MFKNYLTTALRNIFKKKEYSILNISGLVIGITCCLLIFQYVSYEKSYDTFENNSSQIVRLRLDQYKQGQLSWQSATVYPGIGPALKRDYPEVENFCRLINWNGIFANPKNNVKFNESEGYYADVSAVDMLGIKMLQGNAGEVLKGPDKMIVSESMAKKYFGNEDAVGQRLQLRDPDLPENLNYEITGVFRDYPKNSHLAISYLVSYTTLIKEQPLRGDTLYSAETAFGWYDFYTYVQLKKGTDRHNFESKLDQFCDHYINSQQWNKTNNVKNKLFTIPLSDIHLYSNYNQEAEVNGNGKAVAFMFLIGFIIMAIAWINYINLATARSVERGKEVGVRKVLGAGRNQLINQFMLESLLLNFTAVCIAFVATYLLTPVFNTLMGRDGGAGFSLHVKYWFMFSGIFITGTLLSGLYPAFVLSGYKPISVLKGAFKNTSRGLILRKGLIIIQFCISVILIAGTIIVYQQVKFMRNQQLGININQTLVVNGAQSIRDSLYQNIFQPFKNELLQQQGIKGVSASTSVMGKEIGWTTGVRRLGADNNGAVTLFNLGVDYNFIPQFQVTILAGRNFSKDFSTDNNAAILNDKALTLLGFKDAEDALNKKILRGGRDSLTVVGVVKSFHHLGLQRPIDPQLILLRPNTRNAYAIKLQAADISKSISGIEKTWNKYFPNDPFSYFFLDDFFNQQYKADQQFGKVFTLFAMLAIIIACFGLLGLSSYNILQRTKEIGVRKVLGASIQNVVYILAKDFLKLVVIAFIVALPLAWFLMHQWLQDFAFRINISWWVFTAAGLIAFLVALITISFQSIKAAVANPVKSLRTE